MFRIVSLLILLAVAGCVGLWLLSGNRKYLRWALTIVKIAVALGVIFFGLLLIERMA